MGSSTRGKEWRKGGGEGNSEGVKTGVKVLFFALFGYLKCLGRGDGEEG